MNAAGLGAFRSVVLASLASAVAVLILSLAASVPAKVHGWLLGAAGVVFSISEVHFRSLLSELTSILRRGGYSVWQMEQLRQIIPDLRSKIWRLWAFSLGLKAVVILAASALQWDGLSASLRLALLFVGYAFLIYSSFLTVWSTINFRRLEAQCDAIQEREISIKEKKRLRAEVESGEPHDFQSDPNLQTFTKPSQPVA